MGNYCKEIIRRYQPRIEAPLPHNPIEPDYTKLFWIGYFTLEGKSAMRSSLFLPGTAAISMEEREKLFNRKLTERYREW